MKFTIPFLLLFTAFTNNPLMAQNLIVGTYTNTGISQGIYLYRFDNTNAKTTQLSVEKATDPSYLAVSKDNRYIYGVNESDDGGVSAFTYNPKNGTLKLINQQSNVGNAPCYISIDQTGKWLFTANYGDGSLTVYPVNADGSIGKLHQRIQHEGSGINKDRQATPHVHCTYISPDNNHLFVPDLGIDKVMIYPFDAQTGQLNTAKKSWISIKDGGGPRHIIFTKKGTTAYLVEELTGFVNVIKKDGQHYQIIQTEKHLPTEETAAGADIHLSPDEKFLYVSQRSNSTIEIYKVKKDGRLSFLTSRSTLGNFPRNFTIHPSGKYLLAANQKSNDITIFKRNIKTGLLTDTKERITIGAPVCLQWIK